ncbi:MAG TPA: elongation factor Ts, partial [Candidatus Saccharimonadales bacterium]
KPADMVDKIAAGKLDKWYESVVLMEQPYIKDPNLKVEDYVKQVIARLGENIVVRQFSRIELGEAS